MSHVALPLELPELSLCTGGGGGLLAGQILGFRPIAAVEVNEHARETLLRRQRDGVLPLFPIWDDLRTFRGRPWRGRVAVITAGFPCQPSSIAGKGLRDQDPRDLWPDVGRTIGEVGPPLVLLENVANILARRPKEPDYYGRILGKLATLGYDAEWDCIPASAVGAPHQRDRWWLVAYTRDGRYWLDVQSERFGWSRVAA